MADYNKECMKISTNLKEFQREKPAKLCIKINDRDIVSYTYILYIYIYVCMYNNR